MASTVALDTNAYVAFKRGTKAAVELVACSPTLVLPAIVLGELRAGFAFGTRAAQNEAELIRFLGSPRVIVQAVDETVTLAYASLCRRLRREGRSIPTNDLWIAACGFAANAALATYDAHFGAIEGLALVPLQ